MLSYLSIDTIGDTIMPMSKKEKRIAELLEFPNMMRFSDVRNLLEDEGYTLERSKGSHHMFAKKGSVTITIPVHKGTVKIDYLKIIAKTLELAKPKKDKEL
jgi:predicted RNA binding protein YcfA (HicA-like mRNA interferase family)